mmetsp:Transcript_120/g.228  ORF Transcript_120/g.228 Transcript_120/m.228 type:complete len:169 (+) Transcript_120:19-525(+)
MESFPKHGHETAIPSLLVLYSEKAGTATPNTYLLWQHHCKLSTANMCVPLVVTAINDFGAFGDPEPSQNAAFSSALKFLSLIIPSPSICQWRSFKIFTLLLSRSVGGEVFPNVAEIEYDAVLEKSIQRLKATPFVVAHRPDQSCTLSVPFDKNEDPTSFERPFPTAHP